MKTSLSLTSAGLILFSGLTSALKLNAQPWTEKSALPAFLPGSPLEHGTPWGDRTVANCHPKSPPNTGVTRYYDFTATRTTGAPDGFEKSLILINGVFPGPLIEANWGDWIEVKLTNNITGPEEGTSIHYHGLLQTETPWYDGVPSVSQCPIAPGSSFVYRFRADTYGSSWYHSHVSAQYSAGMFGPMIIYGPTHVSYDVDVGHILVSDWFHKDYFTIVEGIVGNTTEGRIQPSNNTMINGRMPYPCSGAPPGSVCDSSKASYTEYKFETGKTYRLRVVNTGAAGIQYFTIDGYELTVVAIDFVEIEPYNTTTVTLGVGQRSDVLFTPTSKSSNSAIWMRTLQSGLYCARSPQNREGRAIIYMDNAQTGVLPNTTAWPAPVDDHTCANQPLESSVPYYAMKLPEPSTTYYLTINQYLNETGHQLYYMNGHSFRADYNDPLLLLSQEQNLKGPINPDWNTVNIGTNTSTRVVITNNNTSPHPMHLHGHDMYVLYSGMEPWNGTIVNPQNPQRRDTHNLAPFGYMVFQFDNNNPGVWPFHCHIAWHLSQGLYLNFIERPHDVKSMEIPMTMKQTCKDWSAYTSKNVVDQIDSGL